MTDFDKKLDEVIAVLGRRNYDELAAVILFHSPEQWVAECRKLALAAIELYAGREPSEEMLDAAFAATVWPDLNRATSSDVMNALRGNMRKEYRAMQAAQLKEIKEGK